MTLFINLLVYGQTLISQDQRSEGRWVTKTKKLLLNSHMFFRTIDTLLRLNDEDVLKINSELIDIIIKFLNLKSKDELIKKIEDMRQKIVEITRKFYEGN